MTSSRLWTSVLALGLLAACRGGADRVAVGKVLVDQAVGGDGMDLERTAVREAVQAALLAAPPASSLRWDPSGPALLKVQAMAGRVPPGPDGQPVLVLRLLLERGGGARPQLPVELTVEQRAESAVERPQAVLEAAVAAGLRRLEQALALDRAPTPQLLATLDGDDRDLRLRALGVLAERREPQSLDALLRTLKDRDEAVALRAVGAVVALGDPRGVNALTDLTHQRSPAFVRQIVYAVAAIGGREAEAYLFTVATGHPDASVQEAARQAQAELAARARTTQAQAATPAP